MVDYGGDITKTAEYSKVIRALKNLENDGIIIKIKPSKNKRFKTHYKMNGVINNDD